MKVVQEFKEFAMKGNVVDMAVGIIIGGAFGTVVKSLVDNIMMPPFGYLAGRVDFANLSLQIPVPDGEPVEVKYGLFINAVISFLIMAFALFLIIQWMNRVRNQFARREAAAPPPASKKCPECLMDVPAAARRCGHCTSVIAAAN